MSQNKERGILAYESDIAEPNPARRRYARNVDRPERNSSGGEKWKQDDDLPGYHFPSRHQRREPSRHRVADCARRDGTKQEKIANGNSHPCALPKREYQNEYFPRSAGQPEAAARPFVGNQRRRRGRREPQNAEHDPPMRSPDAHHPKGNRQPLSKRGAKR